MNLARTVAAVAGLAAYLIVVALGLVGLAALWWWVLG